jgi:DNA-binding NarL/FixJ family response regulator
MPITVAIVEDDARIRRSLAAMLGTADDIECVGQFASAEEALRKIPAIKPRVIFMDIHLPGMSGVDCVRELAAIVPKPQIVMLTSYDDSDAIFSSLSAGACGYLLKPIRTAQLLAAVSDVYSGGAPMSGQIARRVVEAFNKPAAAPSASVASLSEREAQILQLLSEGYLYKEIAEIVFGGRLFRRGCSRASRRVRRCGGAHRVVRRSLRNACGLAHRAGRRFGQCASRCSQLFDFLAHEFAQLAVGLLFIRAVAHAAPWKQIGAVADVGIVFIAPADKLEVFVFGFHRVASRMALRICFSW